MTKPNHIDNEKRILIITGASRGHATVKRFSSADRSSTGAAYAVSKAAALTREMAADFGPRRVNAIAPGEIDTAILSPREDRGDHPAAPAGPAGGGGQAIYYLCTDQSSYVTGAELMINGGLEPRGME
jgi:NAD(P)-dependent dehydrogenase (short-subunit alcohol dehydrogenase family)